jgi:hypothetical protein
MGRIYVELLKSKEGLVSFKMESLAKPLNRESSSKTKAKRSFRFKMLKVIQVIKTLCLRGLGQLRARRSFIRLLRNKALLKNYSLQ